MVARYDNFIVTYGGKRKVAAATVGAIAKFEVGEEAEEARENKNSLISKHQQQEERVLQNCGSSATTA